MVVTDNLNWIYYIRGSDSMVSPFSGVPGCLEGSIEAANSFEAMNRAISLSEVKGPLTKVDIFGPYKSDPAKIREMDRILMSTRISYSPTLRYASVNGNTGFYFRGPNGKHMEILPMLGSYGTIEMERKILKK